MEDRITAHHNITDTTEAWELLHAKQEECLKWELRAFDAEKELVALRAEVERLREERRWRSTKTEPPSDDQWEIMIYDGRDIDIGSKLDGCGWTHEFGLLEWETVTHWMPLPAPPAKEE